MPPPGTRLRPALALPHRRTATTAGRTRDRPLPLTPAAAAQMDGPAALALVRECASSKAPNSAILGLTPGVSSAMPPRCQAQLQRLARAPAERLSAHINSACSCGCAAQRAHALPFGRSVGQRWGALRDGAAAQSGPPAWRSWHSAQAKSSWPMRVSKSGLLDEGARRGSAGGAIPAGRARRSDMNTQRPQRVGMLGQPGGCLTNSTRQR